MATITLSVLDKKLKRLVKRYPEMARGIHQRAAAAALKTLVFRTPVDTGLARGSWRITQSRPSRAAPRKDRTGARTVSAGLNSIRRGFKRLNVIYLTNTSDHLALIDSGVIKITKAQPFAAPGFIDVGLRAASRSVTKDSLFRDKKF